MGSKGQDATLAHTLSSRMFPCNARRLDRHLSWAQRSRTDVVHTSNSLGVNVGPFAVIASGRGDTADCRIRYKDC